jgi:molecular chaperone DnaK
VPQIEVSFDIDANGIVHVSAKDMGTGKEQSMQITGGSALGKDEIDRMMRDAEQHADEDKKRRDEAEVRNQAETLVYQTEKFLTDNDDKVPADAKTDAKTALDGLTEALKGTDTDAIKSAIEKLATESQKVGATLYAQQATQTGTDAPGGDADSQAGSQAGAQGGAEDVVDAEIVDDPGEGDKK